ncbi:hypothetical protein ILUMI_20866 [Ignelater luminosus]|uniref:Uncharacterized protein n=1 Tax=Ignelater luminosus TaxID=2038154 RepID=A0A8K0FYI2_IGNLU|nr:hypothetical protein ILUMI_20866 [Ignelater luminosus]
MTGSSHRVMVRTCNGLELRDAGLYPDSGDFGEDPSGLFPSASSRDELTPRELEAASLSACRIHGTTPPPTFSANLADDLGTELGPGILEDALCRGGHSWHHCPEVHKAIDGVRFIADHTKREEDSTRVSWIYLRLSREARNLYPFRIVHFLIESNFTFATKRE